jgi:hypothetical protein
MILVISFLTLMLINSRQRHFDNNSEDKLVAPNMLNIDSDHRAIF